MSANRQSRGSANRPTPPTQMPDAKGGTLEREIDPEKVHFVSAPEVPSRGVPFSLTEFMGQPEDKEDESHPAGYGPKLVVLDNYVAGPGSKARGHSRGDVIYASQLLGDEVMDNPKLARKSMQYYLDQKAVREATTDEAQYTKVTFIEGEENLMTALEAAQQREADVRAENERLRKLLAQANNQEIVGPPSNPVTPQVVAPNQGQTGDDDIVL